MSSNFDQRVRDSVKQSGDQVGYGVRREVVVIDHSGGIASQDSDSISTGRLTELPSDEKLQASAEVLNHSPLQMRAMFELFKPQFDLQPRQRTAAELVAALGVDEATLVAALAPLVARHTVSNVLTADGDAAYVLQRFDLFLMQLSLA